MQTTENVECNGSKNDKCFFCNFNYNVERARALGGREGIENILDKMSHCCLSRVRAKDNGQI